MVKCSILGSNKKSSNDDAFSRDTFNIIEIDQNNSSILNITATKLNNQNDIYRFVLNRIDEKIEIDKWLGSPTGWSENGELNSECVNCLEGGKLGFTKWRFSQ